MPGSDERYTYEPGALLPGTPYKVQRALGAGGMGVVYAVQHTFLKRSEALKTIHPELIDRRDIAQRMAREASVVGNLRHPNIVQVTGGGVIEDRWKLPYFAMEMLRGKNLRQVLSRKTLTDYASVYNIAYEVLSALAEAHAHGVVHRDVKPENIFLHFDSTRSAGPQVTAKLLDFGVMAVLGGRQSMSFRGTYKYASPEQLRGETVSPQTDVYAMALVVYEMLAGRGPFDDLRDARELVKAHMETEAPRISEFARVHPTIDELLARALEKDPAKRPPTAMGFAMDLRPLKRAPDAPVVLAANTEESLLTTVTGAATDSGKAESGKAIVASETDRDAATSKEEQPLGFAKTKLAEGVERRADEDTTREDAIPPWAAHGGTLENADAPSMASGDGSPVPLAHDKTDVDRRAVTRTADPIPRGTPTHGTEPISEPNVEVAPDSTRRYMDLEAFLLEETSDPTAGVRSTPSRRDGTPPPVSPTAPSGSQVAGAPVSSKRSRFGFVAGAVVLASGALILATMRSSPPKVNTTPAAAAPVATDLAAPATAPASGTSSALPALAGPTAQPAMASASSTATRTPRQNPLRTTPSSKPSAIPAESDTAPAVIAAPPPSPPAQTAAPAPKAAGDSDLKRTVVH